MRPIEQKTARQRAVILKAEKWLIKSGSRLRLESDFHHREIVNNRCVQVARWHRERQLLLYGHIWRRTPHRFRRPR